MKLFFISLFFSLLFNSCDTINQDHYLIDYTPPVPEGADVRRILLEDYTGVRCANCPKAADQAAQLKTIYGDRLIVVGVHAGFFSRPLLGEPSFATEAGTAYYEFFKVTGNPQGIINRLPYQGALYYPFDRWAGAIDALPQLSAVGLDIKTIFDTTTRHYEAEVELTSYHNEGLPTEANLLLWLVEDSIVSPQTVGSDIVKNYMHRHVLRGALTENWGETVSDLPTVAGVTQILRKANGTLPDHYQAKHCTLVALLTNPSTKEIIQAAEVYLTPQ